MTSSFPTTASLARLVMGFTVLSTSWTGRRPAWCELPYYDKLATLDPFSRAKRIEVDPCGELSGVPAEGMRAGCIVAIGNGCDLASIGGVDREGHRSARWKIDCYRGHVAERVGP